MADAGEETEEEERRDGDILGDVKEIGGRKWRSSIYDDTHYEHQWELDPETLNVTTVRKQSIPRHILNNMTPGLSIPTVCTNAHRLDQ